MNALLPAAGLFRPHHGKSLVPAELYPVDFPGVPLRLGDELRFRLASDNHSTGTVHDLCHGPYPGL